MALDHVQLAMPPGGDAAADAFYADTLGLERVPKPEPLAARGGCWYETGPVRIHLGIETDFRPARKAHPALVVSDLALLAGRLADSGYEVTPAEELGGRRRAFVDDPFGNRIELMDPA